MQSGKKWQLKKSKGGSRLSYPTKETKRAYKMKYFIFIL